MNITSFKVYLSGFIGEGNRGQGIFCGVLGGDIIASGFNIDTDNALIFADKFLARSSCTNYRDDNFVFNGFTIEGINEKYIGKNQSGIKKGMYYETTAEELNSPYHYMNSAWDETIWNLENLDIANGVYPTLY